MRLSKTALTLGAFGTALGLSILAATYTSGLIEDASKRAVVQELRGEGLSWAEVDTNGLQVFLIGTAPDEARRFVALSTAARVVDAARVIDQMLVEEPDDIAPPRFQIELLRNGSGISVIGLVPASTDREALLARFEGMAKRDALGVSDLLESADFPAPEGWEDALRFATLATGMLERSKISVEADSVTITAMADSPLDRRRIEDDLRNRAPEGLALELALSAPRPVITPFTMRFVIDENGARFDACSADSEVASARIIAAAKRAGLQGQGSCRIGLGVPSRSWAEAVEMGIVTLAELKGTSVTFTNADVTLIAPEGTDQEAFDSAVAKLEADLPEVFALEAVLPETPDETTRGPMSFTARFDPKSGARLSGWLDSELARATAQSFARGQFSSAPVVSSLRVDEDLPAGWQLRALAGMHALSLLENGTMTLSEETLKISGQTGNAEAGAEISGLLASELGSTLPFDIDVTYVEALDPALAIPSPEQCEAQIVEIIGERKITFEPGSETLDASAEDILDELAELLKSCGEIPLEIGGHTDSQGRESMNQALSRSRAQSVVDALRDRRVPARGYTVVGYGEERPIADNDTAEGREANRRIEFRLIREEAEEGTEDGTEEDSASQPDQADETPSDQEAQPAPEDEATEDNGAQGAANE